MRIVYYLDWPGSSDSGVIAKVTDQISSWKQHGHEVNLILVATRNLAANWKPCETYRFEYHNPKTRLQARRQALARLKQFPPGTVFIRRYGLMWLTEILAIRSRFFFVELNTNNNVYYRRKSFVAWIWHKSQHRLIGRSASGAFAVTGEIAKLEKSIFQHIEVVSNGIMIPSKIPSKKNLPRKTSFVFLAGGDYIWNGIGVLEIIAKQLPDFDFTIIGIESRTQTATNLRYLSHIPPNLLPMTLSQFDFGISTLNLKEVGLSEAAPLKARTYIINDLPVIGRFPDAGLTGSKAYFQLEFSHLTNLLVNIEELMKFIDYWQSRNITSDVLDSVDVFKIEKRRLDFINQAHSSNPIISYPTKKLEK